MINTSCEKCYFARPSNSKEGPCEFGIIDQIKDNKTLKIENDFFYIEEYSCKYGFSKEIAQQYQDKIGDIKLKDYVLSQNTLQYYLVLEHKKSNDIADMCKSINSLEIKPRFLSIILYETDLGSTIKEIKRYIDPEISWKTHNFLDEKTSFGSAIKIALDTKHNLFSIPYLWFNNSEYLANAVMSQAIQKINYIINIEQPICNFVTSRNSNGIYDLFVNTQSYYNLTKHHQCSIDKIIENISTTSVYYD